MGRQRSETSPAWLTLASGPFPAFWRATLKCPRVCASGLMALSTGLATTRARRPGALGGREQAIEVIAPLLIRYYYFLAVPTDDVSGERARGYDLCSEGPYE